MCVDALTFDLVFFFNCNCPLASSHCRYGANVKLWEHSNPQD